MFGGLFNLASDLVEGVVKTPFKVLEDAGRLLDGKTPNKTLKNLIETSEKASEDIEEIFE